MGEPEKQPKPPPAIAADQWHTALSRILQLVQFNNDTDTPEPARDRQEQIRVEYGGRPPLQDQDVRLRRFHEGQRSEQGAAPPPVDAIADPHLRAVGHAGRWLTNAASARIEAPRQQLAHLDYGDGMVVREGIGQVTGIVTDARRKLPSWTDNAEPVRIWPVLGLAVQVPAGSKQAARIAPGHEGS